MISRDVEPCARAILNHYNLHTRDKFLAKTKQVIQSYLMYYCYFDTNVVIVNLSFIHKSIAVDKCGSAYG